MTAGDLDQQSPPAPELDAGYTRIHGPVRFDLEIPVVDQDAYWRCIETFIELVGALPYVTHIYVDVARGLDFYTVYTGNLFDIGDEMMEASGQTLDRSPSVPMDFHFIPVTSAGAVPSLATTHQVFAR